MKRNLLKNFVLPLKTDPFLRWPVRLSFIFTAGTLVTLVWRWQKLPPQIPLFYSLPWGEEQLTSPQSLILFLSGLILINILNFLVALLLYQKLNFLSRTLAVGTCLVTFLGIYTLIQILLLIT